MFKNLEKSKEKGFTLIEVVIVLAIAALIILVVLQAVGAANRANRDTARKNEAGRAVSLFEQSASNNGGAYPADNGAAAVVIQNYDAGLFAKYPVPSWLTVGYQTSTAIVSNWADATCGAVDAATYKMVYAASANGRDYDLAVCTENGKSSLVHPVK